MTRNTVLFSLVGLLATPASVEYKPTYQDVTFNPGYFRSLGPTVSNGVVSLCGEEYPIQLSADKSIGVFATRGELIDDQGYCFEIYGSPQAYILHNDVVRNVTPSFEKNVTSIETRMAPDGSRVALALFHNHPDQMLGYSQSFDLYRVEGCGAFYDPRLVSLDDDVVADPHLVNVPEIINAIQFVHFYDDSLRQHRLEWRHDLSCDIDPSTLLNGHCSKGFDGPEGKKTLYSSDYSFEYAEYKDLTVICQDFAFH